MSLVEVRNVTKKYGQNEVLKNVNLRFESGKIIGLLGPNGSGKTTIIKLLNGLIPKTSGEILIEGKEIGVSSKKIISYLPEKTYLDDSLSVKDCIKFFEDFYEDFDTAKAYQLIDKLNINYNQKIKTLSKGTKEKVQLILVMSRRAKIYILDEPIAGVDPAARDYILDTIMSNFEEGATLIICTHLISDIERILDEVVFLRNGMVLLHDDADNVRSKYNGSIDEAFREVFRCY